MPKDDEERLFDSPAEDAEVARVLDAAASAESNDSTLNVSEEATATIAITPPSSTTPTPSIGSAITDTSGSRLAKRWFILEPAVFLFFFARYLIGAVYQNQILYQACIAVFKYNETQCQPLLGIIRESEEAKVIETKVQPYVANILMATSLIESIIPAFVSLFIGPWSDKFGRRPIILTTFTGYLGGSLILTSLAFVATKVVISPWVFVLSSVPSILSGGICALITGIYCYISDVAKERAKAVRMLLNEASLCAGMMFGNVASGYIYSVTNLVTVFAIAALLQLLALCYVYIFVVESLTPEQIHSGSKIREFFRFDLVKDLVRTCFQRRQNYDRAIIWLTMISLTIAIFTMEGDSNVTYLFLRKQFDWTVKDFTLFNAARIIVQIFGSIFGMIIMRKVLKFSIITMAMIAFASCVLESTVRATAVFWWEMYLAMGFGFMRGVMGPMCRAILSHVAPPTEIGKVFALTTSLESVSPLIAAPLYTTVYDATLQFYPGIFNFISAGLYLFCFTLTSTIFGIQKSFGNAVTYQAIGGS